MRELSLHILDLIENSLRAGGTTIEVTIEADAARDLLTIVIEDNGSGLKVAADDAMNPFYTTKEGKRTGLGLSLFRAAAEQAGGRLEIGQSPLGGVAVTTTMQLSHVDRSPMGDLGGTFASVVLTNPSVDFRFHLRLGVRECNIRISEMAETIGRSGHGGLAAACRVTDMVKTELEQASVSTGLLL